MVPSSRIMAYIYILYYAIIILNYAHIFAYGTISKIGLLFHIIRRFLPYTNLSYLPLSSIQHVSLSACRAWRPLKALFAYCIEYHKGQYLHSRGRFAMVATDDLSSLLGSGARTKGQITTKLHKNNEVSLTVAHMHMMFLQFS